MKRIIGTLALGIMLLGPYALSAHEGQDHSRVKGTVRSIEDDRLVVTTTNGDTVAISIDEATRFSDPEGSRVRTRPKVGDRVVVETAGAGESLSADEVRFSPSSGSGGGHHSREPASAPHDHY